uniref:Uncharacterized protein n=1 Tax=Equus caballus TaxID=9796 RepID=A0A9L0TJA5_HORSE
MQARESGKGAGCEWSVQRVTGAQLAAGAQAEPSVHGRGPLRQWPPPRSRQASSRHASPSLTFESPRSPPRSCPLPRSACLCSRNSAPGSRCCRWASLWSAPPPPPLACPAPPVHTWLCLCSSCKLGSGYPLDRPLTARPLAGLPGLHRCAQRPALPPPSPSTASHRQTAASSDLDSPGRCLSRPRPLDHDSDSPLPPL